MSSAAKSEIIGVLAEGFGVVADASSRFDGMKLDSLDMILLINMVEERCHGVIPDEALRSVTVADLAQYMEAACREKVSDPVVSAGA